MTADAPDLTVAELEQIRDATLRTYEGGDEQYETLPPHLLKVVDGDGGLVNMIDLAIHRTRQLEALRAQEQQDYAAIHAKQQRDHERIAELSALVDANRRAYKTALGITEETVWADGDMTITREHPASGVDRTIVPPGTIAKMRAENPGPTASFREAIARARQRREEPDA